MRLCCRKLAEVAARHLFQVIWLCLRSDSFSKVTCIKNHRLCSGMVHELQIFPLPRLLDYGEGRLGFIDGSLRSFYEKQTWCFFTPSERRRLNIEGFLNSVFASFKNLPAVKLGDSTALTSPRTISAQTLWQRSLYNKRGCRVQISYAS